MIRSPKSTASAPHSRQPASAASAAIPAEGLKTRRAALGAIASALPVLALGAGAALSPSPADAAGDDDAAMFALLAQWRAAGKAAQAADDRLEDLVASEHVPAPAAMIRRPGDEFLFEASESVGEVYTPKSLVIVGWVIDCVRKHNQLDPLDMVAFPRCQEIRAARLEWDAAIKAAREASGFFDLERQSKEARDAESDLRCRVAIAPARTVRGVIAKLTAVAEAFGLEHLEEEAGFDGCEEVTFDDVGLSVIRDWARLAPTLPQSRIFSA